MFLMMEELYIYCFLFWIIINLNEHFEICVLIMWNQFKNKTLILYTLLETRHSTLINHLYSASLVLGSLYFDLPFLFLSLLQFIRYHYKELLKFSKLKLPLRISVDEIVVYRREKNEENFSKTKRHPNIQQKIYCKLFL